MCKYLRNVDFMFMIALIVLEMTTLVLYFLILGNTFDLDRTTDAINDAYFMNLLNSVLSIFLEVTAIWVIIVFGIHSLYFKVIQRLILYIFCSIFIPMFIWLLFTLNNLYEQDEGLKDDLKEILECKQIILYLSYCKSGLYLLTAILTAIERNTLIREVNSAPLLMVDETMTEELYQNIIRQSKNPHDNKLQDEFRRLTFSKQKSTDNNGNSKSIVTNGLDESRGSGLTGVNKVNGSINNNNITSEKTVSSEKTRPLLHSSVDSPATKA